MVLSSGDVRACYDRLGSSQDWMWLFEKPAIEQLISASAFTTADAVVELGCGTGRLAARLLDKHLPRSATYLGLDLSATMVDLARRRLRRFGDRAAVRLTDGRPAFGGPDGAFDRFGFPSAIVVAARVG